MSLVACGHSPKSDRKQKQADYYLSNGTLLLSKGSIPQATENLRKALELEPKNKYAHNNLGLAYLFRGRLKLAEESVRRALEIDPGYSDARNNLGRILIERKNYSSAIKELTQVTNDLTYKSPSKAYFNLGLAFFRAEKYAQAKMQFLEVIKLDRENCLAHNYVGRSMYMMEQYSSSAKSLDTAISFCEGKRVAEPHYFSALSYLKLRALAKARARFQEVIELFPNNTYTKNAREYLETLQ